VSDSRTVTAHMERHVLVLNFTQGIDLNDYQPNLNQWHFLYADSLVRAQHILQHDNCDIAIALITTANQLLVLKVIEQLADRPKPLLWLAILPADSDLFNNLKFCFTDYFVDYHHLPVDWSRLNHTLGHLYGIAKLKTSTRHEINRAYSHDIFFGPSDEMQQLKASLHRIAKTDETVLISGETGTGKGLSAQYIHNLSDRQKGPFVTVNCAALPPTLIHSELFGHEKGAFTGANKQYKGRIERAHKGTLFLDEIGDLPLELQVNLLQFLEERRIERLGGNHAIKVDCRIIFATHVNLEHAVEEGLFREDLYYRINILQIDIPSLRNHKTDIELLANAFLKKLSTDKHSAQFSDEALNTLKQYTWPGNIRELKNRIQRAVIMTESKFITVDDLGIKITNATDEPTQIIDLAQHRLEIDTELILSAIKRNNYNISAAARELNISRATFYRMIKKCKIEL